MSDGPAVFVSAGMLSPKKADHALARLHLYLNFGLLGLASIVADTGRPARVYHGHFMQPAALLAWLVEDGVLGGRFPLFLSLPSAYSIEWAAEFVRLTKAHDPNILIVVGGRWVIGSDASWIRTKLPGANLFVSGTAEHLILDLLDPGRWSTTEPGGFVTSEQRVAAIDRLPDLNFTLMPDFLDFQPSLEMARGCGMGCSFCQEKTSPRSPMRTPRDTIDALHDYARLYGTPEVHPYFEASYFRPTLRWSQVFRMLYRSEMLNTQWRCETRVDAWSPEILENLAHAGLKVIDVGLESASLTQLSRMGKAANPSMYLRSASSLLHRCKSLGLWIKVNILLYAGESADTLEETLEWLESHADCIKGVSVNPLVVYGHDVQAEFLLDVVSQFGARAVDRNDRINMGYTRLHLSREIDHDASLELSRLIASRFMTERDYFDLKSFSYLPRWLSYEAFRGIVAEEQEKRLESAASRQQACRGDLILSSRRSR